MSRDKKFTPGPWSHGVSEMQTGILAHKRYEDGEYCVLVADCNCDVDTCLPSPEKQANAHLIAAAPELLEALERMHKMTSHILSEGGCNPKDWINDLADCQYPAFKAISKAYGETK
jgi:hypothetical protein